MKNCVNMPFEMASSLIIVAGTLSCIEKRLDPEKDPLPTEIWIGKVDPVMVLVIGYVGELILVLSTRPSDGAFTAMSIEDFTNRFRPRLPSDKVSFEQFTHFGVK